MKWEEKTETCSVNTKPCTRKSFPSSCLLEDVEGKKRRRGRGKPNEKKAKVGKRGWVVGVQEGPESQKNVSLETGVTTAGRESFRGSGNTICSESKACKRDRRQRRR